MAKTEDGLTDKPKRSRRTAAQAQATPEPAKTGRPTDYTPELGDLICARLAAGESLKKITDGDDMPGRTTVYRWLREHEAFRNNYTRAAEDRAEHIFDDMFEIADTGNPDDVQRARLRVDTRKWALSKMIPKKYGEKTALVGGDPESDAPIQFDDRAAARRIAHALMRGVLPE